MIQTDELLKQHEQMSTTYFMG